jgi:hypothetical protein
MIQTFTREFTNGLGPSITVEVNHEFRTVVIVRFAFSDADTPLDEILEELTSWLESIGDHFSELGFNPE